MDIDKIAHNIKDDDPGGMRCQEYNCRGCRSTIYMNGSEEPGTCVYCGSMTLVKGDITRHRRPDLTVPFKISREEALSCIKKSIKKGMYIPFELKHLKARSLRSIYVPYWLINAEHYGAASIEVTRMNSTGNMDHLFFARSGWLDIKGLPIPADTLLGGECDRELGAYDLSEAVLFKDTHLEGHLYGISDVTPEELVERIRKEAARTFEAHTIYDVYSDSPTKVLSSSHVTDIDDEDMRYVMLPVWFATYHHDRQEHLVLINGQTGKVVCNTDIDKRRFIIPGIVAGLIASPFAYMAITEMPKLIEEYRAREHYAHDDVGPVEGYFLIASVLVIGAAVVFTELKKLKTRKHAALYKPKIKFVRKGSD